ncbi:MAG: T9SS type A sorting domain-containing protein, partial [Bacteroidota bacterium]
SITQPSALTSSVITTSVSCNGGSNGSATVNVSGGTPAYSYTWLPSGGNSASASGLSAGNYTVNIKDANNCTTTKTLSIAQPAPINTSVSITGGTLTALQSGATYQWVDCNNSFAPISGATGVSYVAPGNGSYAVIITMGSCADTSACQVITSIAFSSYQEIINIYPNPATSSIIVSGVEVNAVIEFFDATGKLVQSITTHSDKEEINVQGLAEGMYIIRIGGKDSVLHKKLLIKR